MSNKDNVQYQEKKGIGWITLNRPEALNALSQDVLQQLASILDKAGTDDAVRAVIITGAGEKAFSAGADIKFLNQVTPLEVRQFARLAVAVNHKLETLGKIVVAAINGYALGGGLELAEACMLRVAARANASKINKTKWTKSLVHASNARISFSVNLIFSSVDGR